jgi:long-chain fatty acid transport protein
MRAKWTTASVLGLLLALQGSASWAAGFGLNEQSAKAMGIGGAFTAIADGPSAMFFNPAGLATLEGLQLEAGFAFVAPTASYTGTVPGLGVNTTVDATKNYFVVPDVYASYRIHDRIAAGLGFFVPYGLAMEWPNSTTVNGQQVGWWGRSIVERISLQTFYFTPQVAVQIHPRIQIGGGLYVVHGIVELRQGVTFNSNPADDVNVDLAASATSFSGTAGLLVSVIPDVLNFGFTYRGGVSFDFQGNAAFTRPDGSTNIAPGLRTQLSDGPGSTSLHLPHVFAFGLAAFPAKPLTIGFGFDVITWSDYDQLAVNFAATADSPNRPTQLNSTVAKNWTNTIVVRLGAEYKIIPSLAVRAGFIYDQAPEPRNTLGPDLPDGDRYELSLGAGYAWRDLKVDLAYQFLTTGTSTSSETSPLPGDWKANAHLLGLSLGYALK